MDDHTPFPDFVSFSHPSYLPPATYTFLPSDPARPQSREELGRDSVGSDSPVPVLVEDHGSDVSTEDDYQHPGTELWDTFWQYRMSNQVAGGPRYPALLNSPATQSKATQSRCAVMDSENRPQAIRTKEDQQTQSRPVAAAASATPKARRTQSPKLLRPRASLSLFPPLSASDPPPGFPLVLNPRSRAASPLQPSSASSLNTSRPTSDGRTTPGSMTSTTSSQHSQTTMSQAVRPSTRSTIRTVIPTSSSPPTPFSALQEHTSSRPPSHLKPLPKIPPEARATSRRPSLANLRKLSLSRIGTASSPSLAHLANSQSTSQGQQHRARPSVDIPRPRHPLRESNLPPPPQRPLPPLPTPPPNVSVFDFDSDDDTPRGFARRLVHDMVQKAHVHRKEKYQRSVTDGRTSSSSSSGGDSARAAETGPGAETVGPVRGEGGGEARVRSWLIVRDIWGKICVFGRWTH
ncbi:hypothetical protein OQA88_6328 [Cercophora sp. LCS_1]